MTIEMASDVAARYARLARAGGARLPDARMAAIAITQDDDAQLRLAIFRALADPTRFVVVELLRRHGALATTELEAATGVASSTLAHHLRALENARVVLPERVGDWTFWRVVAYPLIEALAPPRA